MCHGLMLKLVTEIGHDTAQGVIDKITSSYAAEGLQNPMTMPQPGGPGMMPPNFGGPGPPFGFPGGTI